VRLRDAARRNSTRLCSLGSRAAAFLVTLLLASGYFGTAALKDPFGWFDAIAYAFLLIASAARAPSWRALALLVAFFTDERALLVAPATLLACGVDPPARQALRQHAVATLGAVTAYLAVRVTLTNAFGLAVLPLPASTSFTRPTTRRARS